MLTLFWLFVRLCCTFKKKCFWFRMAMCRAAEWNIKRVAGDKVWVWSEVLGAYQRIKHHILWSGVIWWRGELTSEVIRATEDVWYQSDWVMNGSTVFAGNAKNRSEIMLLKRVWWSRNTYSGSFGKVPWDLDHGISNLARHGQSGHERRRKHVWNVLSAESTGSTRAGADGCSLLDCAEILCRIVGNL